MRGLPGWGAATGFGLLNCSQTGEFFFLSITFCGYGTALELFKPLFTFLDLVKVFIERINE